MKEQLGDIKTKLEMIKKGLDLMGKDRYRALSNHETVDLIEELRGVTAMAISDVEKLDDKA